MQKTYIFDQLINFTQHDFYAQPGDQAIYNRSNITMTVYRNGSLIKTFEIHSSSLESMERSNWLHEEGHERTLPKVDTNVEEEEEWGIGADSIPDGIEQCGIEVAPMLTKEDLSDKPTLVEYDDDQDDEVIVIEADPCVKPGENDEVVEFEDAEEPETESRKKPGPKAKKAK